MTVDDPRNRRIDEADFSVRTVYALKKDFTTLGELTGVSAQELLRIPNFGRKSLREVEEFLARYRLYLLGSGPEAARLSQAKIVALRELRAMTERQSANDDLWFAAETAREAVLQKDLRWLHDKIRFVTDWSNL